jgi:hypothetical protein
MNGHFSIEWIRGRIADNEYVYSNHGDQERQNDNLLLADVEAAINSGCIIEQYEDTGRGASCLVAGFTSTGVPVHAVCGERGREVVIITVYIPKPPKFKNVYERG